MAAGSAEADDGYIHILGVAADDSHEAQIFRMHCGKRLEALARAYVVFRKLEPGDEARRFRMSSLQQGELDPLATAASYGFSNGAKIVFTEVSEGTAEPSNESRNHERQQSKHAGAVLPEHATRRQPEHFSADSNLRPLGRRRDQSKLTIGQKFRRCLSAAARKKRCKSKRAKQKSTEVVEAETSTSSWAHVIKSALPENMSEQPPVAPELCETSIVNDGPAQGWRVTAWLKGYKTSREGRPHDKVICWRISSPKRTRTFDTFSSSRGTPNLKDAVDESVFTQIIASVKPALAKRMREKRMQIEGASKPNPKSRAMSQKQKGACDKKTTCTAGKEHGLVKRAIVTPARILRPSAAPKKQARMGREQAGKASKDRAWACGCAAHLTRSPRCTRPGELQPSVVHVQDHMIIGRAETCDLIIDSMRAPQMISRCHALLQRKGDIFWLTDHCSLNGMLVNGQRVRGRLALTDRDEITFGVPHEEPELDYIFELCPFSS